MNTKNIAHQVFPDDSVTLTCPVIVAGWLYKHRVDVKMTVRVVKVQNAGVDLPNACVSLLLTVPEEGPA